MQATKSFRRYLSLFGPHFTKDLCDFATSMMENDNGKLTPLTKQDVDQKLSASGITLKYNLLYDYVYVANMCKADFLGYAVPSDDRHLALYVQRTIDDPDGYDGLVFYRWLSDMEHMKIPVDWSEFV